MTSGSRARRAPRRDLVRAAVLEVLQAIAPELDTTRLDADRPLREQVDLDSIDWLNVLLRLRDRLQVPIPDSDYGRLTSLNAIVDYLGTPSRHRRSATGDKATGADPLATRIHRLPGNVEVAVRPARPEDLPQEAEFFRHLSAESRYKRFMAAIGELPEKKLRALASADASRQIALVATAREGADEIEVGIASYAVAPDARSCEMAIVLDDGWHHSGLAGVMMADLIDVARHAGLERMDGYVLASNQEMIRFARQLGFTTRHDPDDPRTVLIERSL